MGQSVKEVVSSDPLKKPGYCPRGQNRNVTVPTISISLVWQHSSHEVRQGQNFCAGCVLPLELGQLVSHFLYRKTCEEGSVACCPWTLVSHDYNLLYFLPLLLLFLKLINEHTDSLIYPNIF